MRHIFLINPMAGGGKNHDALTEKIRSVCTARGVDFMIHVTRYAGDATETVRTLCAEATTDHPIRFYACGGDGTLCEVLAGMADCPYAELGLIPCGTGNDFARNMTPKELFFDIDAQLDGEAVSIDLLYANERPCINMINIGFDCEVVCKKDEYNQKPHFPHKLAYVIGVAATFFHMPGIRARISIDGGPMEEHQLQLTTMANGEFCGGGFHSNPRAALCDGKIDVLQILPVSRFTFLRLIGSYKAGTHLDGDKNAAILNAFKCRSLHMIFDRDQNICIDGDVSQTRELHVEVVSNAVRVVLPNGCTLCHPFTAAAPAEVTV